MSKVFPLARRDRSVSSPRAAEPGRALDPSVLADAARQSGNWAVAAYYYAKLVARRPSDVGLHLQLGHMFKALGLHHKAALSYQHALELAPEEPESYVQLAILSKLMGDFTEAERLFLEARDRRYADTEFLNREIGFLRSTDGRRSTDDSYSAGATQRFRVFLSSTMGAPRPDTATDMSVVLGLANYSYSFIVKGYVEALEALGIDYDFIDHPEYVPDIRDRSACPINLHIGFYPPNGPRVLKGAYNIFVMAWEFERLPSADEIISYHAFCNPAQMLSLADEIWSISEFGAEAVRGDVSRPVYAVPTPILTNIQQKARDGLPRAYAVQRLSARLDRIEWVPLAIVPQMLEPLFHEAQRRRSTIRSLITENAEVDRPVFFLSIMNVHDFRKQIKPAIEAFIRFAKEHDNAFMLLKLTIANQGGGTVNEHLFRSQIADGGEVAPPFVSDRIWITSTVMSREELVALYDISAFYIATPHGEGQNLPLIEAMSRGVVPVSVDNTAMREYINEDNSVVVKSELSPFSLRLADRYKMSRLRTFYVSPHEVFNRLKEAISITDQDYGRRSQRCIETVRRRFGTETFGEAILRAVAAAECQIPEKGKRS